MKKITLLVAAQILLLISIILSWAAISINLMHESNNESIITLFLTCNQGLIVVFFFMVYHLSKFGTSITKRIGTIVGYILLIFIFIFNFVVIISY